MRFIKFAVELERAEGKGTASMEYDADESPQVQFMLPPSTKQEEIPGLLRAGADALAKAFAGTKEKA